MQVLPADLIIAFLSHINYCSLMSFISKTQGKTMLKHYFPKTYF